jgi:hypothetical protein
MKLTPVLIVEKIEDSLPFWVERLAFVKTVEVPEDGRLGFAILVKDGAEVMLQTSASVRKDTPQVLANGRNFTALFVEVNDVDDVKRRLEGCEVIVTERVTFYGMREIGYREPGGHVVVFAARVG